VAKKGSVVNLNYGAKTKDLESLVPGVLLGGIYHVKAEVGKKLPLQKGRTMWDITLGVVIVREPKVVDADFGVADDTASA
jgi:hypothetical protein